MAMFSFVESGHGADLYLIARGSGRQLSRAVSTPPAATRLLGAVSAHVVFPLGFGCLGRCENLTSCLIRFLDKQTLP